MKPTGQRGFTLIEVLLVMSLGLFLLGATLTAFETFMRNESKVDKVNQSVEIARGSIDIAARQLRNLANQDPAQPTTTIAVAGPYDIVFQTSDPSRKWERYCLDTASASRGRLWQSETSTPNAPTGPMLGGCPGSGWAQQRLVADYVTNRINGQDRPAFTYACSATAPTGCPRDATEYGRITSLVPQLFINPFPGKRAEVRVTTAVFLRNQNEKPAASFSWLPAGQTRVVLLNASGSSDPEGRTLLYDWFSGTGTITLRADQVCNPDIFKTLSIPGLTYLGEGVMLRYTFPTTVATSSSQPIKLLVRDPGCLYDSTQQSVTVPR